VPDAFSTIIMRTHTALSFALLFVVACSSPQVSVGRPPAPLVGTDWALVDLHDLPTIAGHSETHATFRIDDGKLIGFTGCNRMSGPVTHSGDKVHFGPLATTKVACLDTNVGRVEAGFLTALNAATRQVIIGDTLNLLGPSGTLARFIVTTPR
jgi:heat shock protein HslJ